MVNQNNKGESISTSVDVIMYKTEEDKLDMRIVRYIFSTVTFDSS